ncbi:MAG: hypothetical protein R3C49_17480 [Planctomycetaceae bacterium]
MLSFVRESLFGLAAFGTGVVLTVLVAGQLGAPEEDLRNAELRFSELDAVQQDDLKNRAAAYLGPAGEASLQRVEAIHAAVGQDPQLNARLDRIVELLGDADEETRFQLRPNGTFADDWVETIQRLDSRQPSHDRVLEVEIPSFSSSEKRTLKFTDAHLQAFLDAAVPQPVPDELAERLKVFNGPEMQCEASLAKTIWLLSQLLPENRIPEKDRNLRRELVVTALRDHLIPEDLRKEFPPSVDTGRPDDQRRTLGFFAAPWLFQLLTYYGTIFDERHTADLSSAVEIFGDECNREKQLALMRQDPSDAARDLVKSVNPEVDALKQDLMRLRRFARVMSDFRNGRGTQGRSGRGGFGRNRPSGPDDRPQQDGREPFDPLSPGPPPDGRGRPDGDRPRGGPDFRNGPGARGDFDPRPDPPPGPPPEPRQDR